jgi:hypothetical protein
MVAVLDEEQEGAKRKESSAHSRQTPVTRKIKRKPAALFVFIAESNSTSILLALRNEASHISSLKLLYVFKNVSVS